MAISAILLDGNAVLRSAPTRRRGVGSGGLAPWTDRGRKRVRRGHVDSWQSGGTNLLVRVACMERLPRQLNSTLSTLTLTFYAITKRQRRRKRLSRAIFRRGSYRPGACSLGSRVKVQTSG